MRALTREGSPGRPELIALAAITLLALGLRILYLGSMEFGGDSAFNLMKARELAHLREFPLTSAVSSTDIPEPPIFMYLLALPIALSDDAVFVTGAIALVNALAVIPLFLIVRKHIGPAAAWASVALYAVNPWAVIYSRKIWTQNLLPFFALLYLYTLFEALFADRPRLLFASLGLMAIAAQLHLSAWFLIPFTIAVLVWQRRRVDGRSAALGTALAFLFFLPYLIYLTAHIPQTRGALAALGGGSFTPRGSGILYPLQLVTTDGFHHVTLLFSSYESFSQTLIDLDPLDYLARALVILGGAYALLQPNPATRALGGYAAFSVIAILLSNVQIFPHYYNASIPVLFVLAALPIALSITKGRRWIGAGSLTVFAGLVLFQLYFTLALLSFIAGEACIWGEYGPPYRVQVQRVGSALEAIEEEGAEVELEALHERAKMCVDWDIRSTEYLYGQLSDQPLRP